MVFVLIVALCGLVSSINVEIVAQEALEENVATQGRRDGKWDVGAYLQEQFAGTHNIAPKSRFDVYRNRAKQLRRDLQAATFEITVTLDTAAAGLELDVQNHIYDRWKSQHMTDVVRARNVDDSGVHAYPPPGGVLTAELGPGPATGDGEAKFLAFIDLIAKCVEAALPADLTKFMGGILGNEADADVPKLVTAVIAHLGTQDFFGVDIMRTLGLPNSPSTYLAKYPKFPAAIMNWTPVNPQQQWAVKVSINLKTKKFHVHGQSRTKLIGKTIDDERQEKLYKFTWSYDFSSEFVSMHSSSK